MWTFLTIVDKILKIERLMKIEVDRKNHNMSIESFENSKQNDSISKSALIVESDPLFGGEENEKVYLRSGNQSKYHNFSKKKSYSEEIPNISPIIKKYDNVTGKFIGNSLNLFSENYVKEKENASKRKGFFSKLKKKTKPDNKISKFEPNQDKEDFKTAEREQALKNMRL